MIITNKNGRLLIVYVASDGQTADTYYLSLYGNIGFTWHSKCSASGHIAVRMLAIKFLLRKGMVSVWF